LPQNISYGNRRRFSRRFQRVAEGLRRPAGAAQCFRLSDARPVETSRGDWTPWTSGLCWRSPYAWPEQSSLGGRPATPNAPPGGLSVRTGAADSATATTRRMPADRDPKGAPVANVGHDPPRLAVHLPGAGSMAAHVTPGRKRAVAAAAALPARDSSADPL
jgi:hypothetical protein